MSLPALLKQRRKGIGKKIQDPLPFIPGCKEGGRRDFQYNSMPPNETVLVNVAVGDV